jgi:hypothetical protein
VARLVVETILPAVPVRVQSRVPTLAVAANVAMKVPMRIPMTQYAITMVRFRWKSAT